MNIPRRHDKIIGRDLETGVDDIYERVYLTATCVDDDETYMYDSIQAASEAIQSPVKLYFINSGTIHVGRYWSSATYQEYCKWCSAGELS